MHVKIESSWHQLLASEFEKPYFLELTKFVKQEYSEQTVFPAGKLVFTAFDHCPVDQVKIVIVGQDPYHGPCQANGFCFSVNPGVPMPPSLINIFKEIKDDLGKQIPPNGDLSRWARQGVLLLNATLTVRSGQAGSHQGRGWEQFTDAAIHKLSALRKNLVYMLWGSYAQKKGLLLDSKNNLILSSPHPSPLSVYRGFSGNRHFSQANAYLVLKGLQPINW